MLHMPIAGNAVIRAVLAKGWDNDTIGKRYAAQSDRRKELICHGGSLSCCRMPRNRGARGAPPAVWRNGGAGGAHPRVFNCPPRGVERASGIAACSHYDAKPRAIQVKL